MIDLLTGLAFLSILFVPVYLGMRNITTAEEPARPKRLQYRSSHYR